jgi:hypothetical protein
VLFCSLPSGSLQSFTVTHTDDCNQLESWLRERTFRSLPSGRLQSFTASPR